MKGRPHRARGQWATAYGVRHRRGGRHDLLLLLLLQHDRRVGLAACAVGSGNVIQLHALARSIAKAQRAVWKVRWDNHVKEVYWRLVLNGLATAERLHKPEQRCLCAQPGPGRLHHFWECPVARAVADTVATQLVGPFALRPAGQVLTARHLMLMRPPDTVSDTALQPAIHEGVWQVVCLAAVAAMDVGRRATAKWYVRRQEQQRQQRAVAPLPPDQQLITDFFMGQPPSAAEQQQQVAAAAAAQQQVAAELAAEQQAFEVERQPLLAEAVLAAPARFWELLADFVEVGTPPDAWVASGHERQVPRAHPFIQAGGTSSTLSLALSPRVV